MASAKKVNDTEIINVRVPSSMVKQMDEAVEERFFSNRSEFIRAAIRDALTPTVKLSQEAREALEEGLKDIEEGRTHSHEEVKEKLGIE